MNWTPPLHRSRYPLFSLFSLLVGLLAAAPPGALHADGNENLGEPAGVAIAPGTGILASGIGLFTQPGKIELTVPAGVKVQQVLLYWQERGSDPDDTIVVNGNEIKGQKIGVGNAPPGESTSFRADVTELNLLAGGANTLTVEGLSTPADPERRNDGAAVLAIVDDGSGAAGIQVRDGNDFAYFRLPPPAGTTVPQTFTFDPATADRVADLFLLVGDGEENRPDEIEVRVGDAVHILANEARSRDGAEWDTIHLEVDVPAGTGSATIQLFSRDATGMGGLPDSLSWVAAAFALAPQEEGGEGCTPGYWKQKQHFDSWPAPYLPSTPFADVFDDAFPRLTLLQVLKLRGGKLNALGRHAVAALLSAASPDVSYDLSPEQVIDLFNDAFHGSSAAREKLKNLFERFNSQGCPLN